jgi:preprotein translocase subunit SecE
MFNYVKETRAEMKHVSWPTRKQVFMFTSLVIIISIVVSLFLGLFDGIFTYLLETFVANQ